MPATGLLRRLRRLQTAFAALCAVCAAVPVAMAAEGAAVYAKECQACHAVEAGAAPRQGPNLFGIVGRKAGSQQGFSYSAGLKKADFAWTAERLDAWLANPQAMIPDSYMAYGQADPQTRARVIAYLETLK